MDAKSKVYDLVSSFSTTMLVTHGPGRRPESRPMQVAAAEKDGNIWFFAGQHGRVVDELAHDSNVLLVFQDERSKYLSIRGSARVVNDRVKAKQLFTEGYRVWFPGGLDDPELALVAVEPFDAEYWDNTGVNKLQYMFESAKAYAKGERPRVEEPEQHAKVAL